MRKDPWLVELVTLFLWTPVGVLIALLMAVWVMVIVNLLADLFEMILP